ncbi:MAG: ECF transporter S component [Lachnospiraceae bacterium]|nr:ECF transporter S component [Lachnospiraceae bacterium]
MNKNSKKGLIISILVIAIAIPGTVALSYLFGDRKLYIASVIIMILAMVPFFVSFEGNKPDARLLATLAVMTAIAVVSRVAFIWAPSFKPMAGVIIMTAIAFGPQSGFMCGALSMIVSNIMFGQGPWTPWQMFCYGMIGFVAGLLANGKILSDRHVIRTSVISFFIVVILSSLILDTSSVLMMTTTVTFGSAMTIYLAGLIPNILNATASALTVFLLLKPLTAILNRLKKKYGMNI